MPQQHWDTVNSFKSGSEHWPFMIFEKHWALRISGKKEKRSEHYFKGRLRICGTYIDQWCQSNLYTSQANPVLEITDCLLPTSGVLVTRISFKDWGSYEIVWTTYWPMASKKLALSDETVCIFFRLTNTAMPIRTDSITSITDAAVVSGGVNASSMQTHTLHWCTFVDIYKYINTKVLTITSRVYIVTYKHVGAFREHEKNVENKIKYHNGF